MKPATARADNVAVSDRKVGMLDALATPFHAIYGLAGRKVLVRINMRRTVRNARRIGLR
jgi:hypothetical protein